MAEETLRDQLEGAFGEAEQIPAAAESVTDTRSSERARDEAGRFAKQEQERQQAEEQKVERPSTWKKDYWEKYDKLDPDLRQYILQRETEYKSGLAAYNAEVKAAKALREALDPVMPDLQRNNVDPGQFVRNLAAAHQALAMGSPQTKLQIFQRLAQDYQVPLQYLLQQAQGQPQQMDPNIQYLTQNLQGLQQQWQQFQQQQKAVEDAQLQQTIEEFRADTNQHPHFEAVRESMAALLQSGMAQNLQEAYDKAIWMSPDIRQNVLTAQQQSEQAKKLEQQKAIVSKAKAQAVSPRSSTPGAQSTGTGKKGLREQLSL
jgi:hypothetical protein